MAFELDRHVMSEITFVFVRLRRKDPDNFGNYSRDKHERYFPIQRSRWRIDLQWSCVKGWRLQWGRTVKMAVFVIRVVTPPSTMKKFRF